MLSNDNVFHRPKYAEEMAEQLLHPTALQLSVRSGVFLSGIRRVGKTTPCRPIRRSRSSATRWPRRRRTSSFVRSRTSANWAS